MRKPEKMCWFIHNNGKNPEKCWEKNSCSIIFSRLRLLGGLWTDAECGWSFYNNNNKRPRVLWLVKSLRNGCCVISGAWKKPLGSQSIRCEHTSSVVCVESKAHQLHELAVHLRLGIFIISSCGHKDWSKEIRGGRAATVALASTTTSITLDTPSASTTTRVTLGVRLV